MRIMFSPILLICLTAAAFGQSGTAERSHSLGTDLRLYAELDKESVRLGEDIRLKVRVKNVSRSPVAIYKNRGWVDPFTLIVTDGGGRRLRPTKFLEDFSASRRKREDYIVLQPNEEYRDAMTLNLRDDYHDAGLPGDYQVAVVYRGTRGREEAPEGMRLWAAEDPELKAEPLKIKVVD